MTIEEYLLGGIVILVVVYVVVLFVQEWLR